MKVLLLATIVEKKGSEGVSYKAIIRLSGRPLRVRTFKTKTQAKLWAQAEETRMREGEVRDVGKEARLHTVAELIDAYARDVLSTKAPNTQRNEATFYRSWKERIGECTLAQITPEIISSHLSALASEIVVRQPKGRLPAKRSKQTMKHYRNTLDRVFQQGVEWRWLGANPLERVPRITKINNQRIRFLDGNELDRLLQSCRQSHQSYLYPIVVFALSTGARKSEITGLTVRDIDLENGLATFRRTKNAETRRVHISITLRQVLVEQIERLDLFYGEGFKGTRWLFPNADGSGPIDVRAAWEAARERAGIEDFRFHDLRHTAASYLAMNGATLIEIATVLGHRTLQMVQRYAHISERHTAEVVERMNKRMFKDESGS